MYFFSKEVMETIVMYLLVGKAATEICYGVVDTGAGNFEVCVVELKTFEKEKKHD